MRLLAAALLSTLATTALAEIGVHDAYTLPTTASAMSGVAYMTIRNDSDTDDRLMGVRSDAAARVMVHVTTQTDTGVMQMRSADDGIALPAGGELLLAPEGTHIMFMGLTAPFTAGETIAITLEFENAGDVTVDLPVKAD